MLRDDGSELRGEDLLIPSARRARRGKVGYSIRFHTGPGVDVRLSEDGKGAGLLLPDGSQWQFRVKEGKLALEESMWVDGNGRPHPIQQIVLAGMASRSGASFAWLFKKMG
jgi:uncharacterized heparinase superfamily protein